MTLCPNCGTWIAEEDLECGCWTCGFSLGDVKRETKEENCNKENSDQSVSRLSSSVFQTGEKNAQ